MRRLHRLGCAFLLALGPAAPVVLLSLGTACNPAPTRVTTELQIGGMVCASCSEAITHALQKQPGVESVAVDHSTGHATIRHDPGQTDRAALIQVITGLGYTVAP